MGTPGTPSSSEVPAHDKWDGDHGIRTRAEDLARRFGSQWPNPCSRVGCVVPRTLVKNQVQGTKGHLKRVFRTSCKHETFQISDVIKVLSPLDNHSIATTDAPPTTAALTVNSPATQPPNVIDPDDQDMDMDDDPIGSFPSTIYGSTLDLSPSPAPSHPFPSDDDFSQSDFLTPAPPASPAPAPAPAPTPVPTPATTPSETLTIPDSQVSSVDEPLVRKRPFANYAPRPAPMVSSEDFTSSFSSIMQPILDNTPILSPDRMSKLRRLDNDLADEISTAQRRLHSDYSMLRSSLARLQVEVTKLRSETDNLTKNNVEDLRIVNRLDSIETVLAEHDSRITTSEAILEKTLPVLERLTTMAGKIDKIEATVHPPPPFAHHRPTTRRHDDRPDRPHRFF